MKRRRIRATMQRQCPPQLLWKKQAKSKKSNADAADLSRRRRRTKPLGSGCRKESRHTSQVFRGLSAGWGGRAALTKFCLPECAPYAPLLTRPAREPAGNRQRATSRGSPRLPASSLKAASNQPQRLPKDFVRTPHQDPVRSTTRLRTRGSNLF